MAKTFSPKSSTGGSQPNYAYKPAKIGAIIQGIMEAKKISKKTVAQYMKVTVRTVENWLEAKFLDVPIMMELSVLLGESLLLYYHPNVKPLPNVLQSELDKLKSELNDLRGVQKENIFLKNKHIKLKGQLELLMEQLEKRNGR